MNATKRIVIGIPTYRRPKSLVRLLASLAVQQASFTPHVVVADNEGEGGVGLKVVAEVRSRGFPFPLTAIAVPERGISQVRNAVMKVAFEELSADALAMVDDDNRVGPGWIAALVAMQEQGAFDVVGGAVIPEFERTPPKWSDGLNIYWQIRYPSGAIPMIDGTGNILLSRALHERFPARGFDPSFGLTGGEDREFFIWLQRNGARFGFAPEAISYELYGDSRVTRRWALQRAYRSGSCDARIVRLHSTSAGEWADEIAKLVAALVVSSVMFLVMAWSPARQMRVVLMLARQFGKLNGWFSKPPRVYESVHGK